MTEYPDVFVCLSGELRDEFQLTPQTPRCYCFSSKKKEKELQLLLPVVLDASAGHSGLSQTTENTDFVLYFLQLFWGG